MACFLVPTGETVVVKAVEKAVEKREQNAGISEPAARFAQFLRERLQETGDMASADF